MAKVAEMALTYPEVIIPVPSVHAAPRMQVNVHVQTEVVAPNVARKRANVWLLENVGNLL